MRFIITLRVNARKFGRLLPLNYQYEMSAVIYKILSSADTEFSTWLHENGFQMDNGKQFKLFTFSRFNIPSFRILRQSNQLELKHRERRQSRYWKKKFNRTIVELKLLQACTDQVGGDPKRKITSQKFKQYLLEISSLDFPAQKESIENFIDTWRGDIPQTDDISLLAFRV